MRNGAAGGAKLIFELLVAVLQLLNGPGQLPDLGLETLNLQNLIGARPFRRLLRAALVWLLSEHTADRGKR